MSKHTPGPWKFYTKPQPNGCPIVGNSCGLMVAMLAHSINHEGQREEAEANARLIAAAPELLEAIEDRATNAAIASGLGASEWRAFLTDKERAAIAKATQP